MEASFRSRIIIIYITFHLFMKKISMLAAAALMALSAHAQTALDLANAGDECMRKEDYKGAIENYVKSLELDMERIDYTTAMQLGYCYEQTQEWQKAGDSYKDSYLRGSYDPAVINNMKRCYESAQCNDCLKDAYIAIAEFDPEQKLPMTKRLYNLYVKENNYNKLLECCETILTDDTMNDENRLKYLKNAASFALKMDSTDIAESYYEKVLAMVPDDADIHKALGFGLYQQISRIDTNAKAAYSAKQKNGKVTQHDYSVMITATKRATLKYGPKAIEHLKIANATLHDAEVSKVIAQLQNNIAAYSK